jgi:NAD(P)-dependent dehydrogenase (short-subunit alcohol dehydrogenase family)
LISPEDVSLAGRVAIVTGGAQGIGEGIALGFASFGADVALCDRNADGLDTVASAIEGLGRKCFTSVMDVRDATAVGSFVSETVSRLGRLDVLVNNAGGGFFAPFMDVNAKGQTALVNENFTSVTDFVRCCVPVMSDGGSIINITSIEAFRAAPGFAVYAAMKAGVEQLTRSLALELSDRRIRVNTIAPDATPTPGDTGLAAAVAPDGNPDYGWKIPLGLGSTDDSAGAAVFLACDLSKWITGTTIHVDGGSMAASGWRRGPDGRFEP